MPWLSDKQWFALAVVFYGLSVIYSVFLWRKGYRRDDRMNYGLLLTGFLLHTAAMMQRGMSFQHCPVRNLYEATTFSGWMLAAAFLGLGLAPRLRSLGVFVSPLLVMLGVFALVPELDRTVMKPEHTGPGLSVHVTLFALAYGAMGLSAAAGGMFLMQERDLKKRRLRVLQALLPPIQRLEVVSARSLVTGFVILTLAVCASVFWARKAGGIASSDPKVIWTWLVWLLYGGLAVWRWRWTPGGHRFAWGALLAFAFVALTFWGASLLSPVHHP